MTLRELLDAATPGPWNVRDLGHGPRYVQFHFGGGESYTTRAHSEDDARLIALAPELAGLLLDMADALRAVLHATISDDEIWALLARLDRISTQTERDSNNAAPVRPQDPGQGSEHGPTAIAAEPQEPRSVCVCDPGDCGEDCGTA